MGTAAAAKLVFGIPEGDVGPMPNIGVGNVTNVNLDPGNIVGDATVTLTEATNSTDPSYTFHFGIPIGKTGSQPTFGLNPHVSNVGLKPGNIVGDATVSIASGADPSYSFTFGIPVGKTGSTPPLFFRTPTTVPPTVNNALGSASVDVEVNPEDPPDISYALTFNIPGGIKGETGATPPLVFSTPETLPPTY